MISIVTVNLDNLAGLRRTVQSVQAQTFREFEHIIIDGGSTDGSRAIIESNASSFSYWVSESDNGVYAAMNKGIRQASGEYLLFLNAGDFLVNDSVLESISSHLKGHELIIGKLKDQGMSSIERFWQDSLPHPCTFIRKELFDQVGLYDESYRIISDWAFFVKALFLQKASYRFVDLEVAAIEEGGLSRRKGSLVLIREEKKRFVMEHPEIRNEDFVDQFFAMDQQLDDLGRSRLMKWMVRIGRFRYLKDLFGVK